MSADPGRSATRRSVLLGAATLAALSAPAASRAQSAAGPGAARASELAKALFAATQPVPVPALSLAVAGVDGLLWAEAFGKADLEFDIDATPAHRFKLNSVSKVLTATMAAKLASRGVLDLDAPVSTWLPDLPEPHRQTTMKQLLTHRGGLRHYIPRDLDAATPGGAIDFRAYPTNKDILEVFINDPQIGAPGAQVSYSTFGYTLASLAMEAAAGRSFVDLITSEIGTPFGLPSLDVDAPDDIKPMRASGYNDDFTRFILMGSGVPPTPGVVSEWTNSRYSNPAYKLAGGGLLMTPSDLARFGAAHLESPASKITSEERTLLFTPLTEATEDLPPLGLGWRVDADDKGRLRWHHAGGQEGGRSSLVVYPELGLSIALASNMMTAPGNVLQPSSDLADAFA